VADATTAGLMEHMYRRLGAGASKAAALRAAQCAALQAEPGLHPAFWGAFQLVGDARPLSTEQIALAEKEPVYVRVTTTA
jgi:CHAT domain-containing protein